MIETYKIKEIFPGHYQTILDFPTAKDLNLILDESDQFVWGINHYEGSMEWSDYDFRLFGQTLDASSGVKARNIEMEYLMETKQFIELLPKVRGSVTLIQTNQVPPYYLNLSRLEGKSKYDLLKDKIDYLFEVEIPGASDYAPLVSPSNEFLREVINRFNNR